MAVPLAAAALLVAATKVMPRRAADVLAQAVALTTTGVCAALVVRTASGPVVHWFGGWTPRGGVAVGVAFAVDGLGAGMAAFASLLVVAALVFSLRFYDSVGTLFHALMLVILAGMVGFAFAADLFDLFVFLELVAAATYALVAYRIEERGPLEASLNAAVTNTVGGLLLLVGIALVYGRTDALNLGQVFRSLDGAAPTGVIVVALTTIAAGFLVKAAGVPFHLWLADAYAVVPIPAGAVFAGVLTELGLFGLARIRWTAFAGLGSIDRFDPVILAVGAITAVVGAVMCLPQRRLKRLLAFIAVAHSGILLMGLGLATPEALGGTALYLVADGSLKAALFLAVGILKHRRDSVQENTLAGRGRDLRSTGLLFLLAGLGIAGLPPFGTALGKGLIEGAALEGGLAWVPWLLGAVSALTGGAVLRAAGRIFLGWGRREAGGPADEEETRETEGGRRGTPLVMTGPAFALVVVAVAMGCVPRVSTAAGDASARFREPAAYATALLDGGARSEPVPPPPPWWDRATVLAGLGGAAAAIVVAMAALDRIRPREGMRRAASRTWEAAMAPARALHGGPVGDQIAWLVAGSAALGIAFTLALGALR